MKSFNEFVLEGIETIEPDEDAIFEDSAMSSTTTAGVANPDAKPLSFKRSKFMDTDCLEVDEDTFHRCVKGKIPYARWKRYITEPELQKFVKKAYQKSKKLLVKDSKTGAMVYIK